MLEKFKEQASDIEEELIDICLTELSSPFVFLLYFSITFFHQFIIQNQFKIN